MAAPLAGSDASAASASDCAPKEDVGSSAEVTAACFFGAAGGLTTTGSCVSAAVVVIFAAAGSGLGSEAGLRLCRLSLCGAEDRRDRHDHAGHGDRALRGARLLGGAGA